MYFTIEMILRWATATGNLAQLCKPLTTAHFNSGRLESLYLKATLYVAIHFSGSGKTDLSLFRDISSASCRNDRKWRNVHVFMKASEKVGWWAWIKTVVACLACGAEYISFNVACKDVICLCQWLMGKESSSGGETWFSGTAKGQLKMMGVRESITTNSMLTSQTMWFVMLFLTVKIDFIMNFPPKWLQLQWEIHFNTIACKILLSIWPKMRGIVVKLVGGMLVKMWIASKVWSFRPFKIIWFKQVAKFQLGGHRTLVAGSIWLGLAFGWFKASKGLETINRWRGVLSPCLKILN